MEVLAVALPFELLRERLAQCALGQRLANPQAAGSRMCLALGLGQAADPAAPRIIVAMAAQDVVHAVDERECEVAAVEREQVSDRERIGPEIAALRLRRRQSGALGEAPHQIACELA